MAQICQWCGRKFKNKQSLRAHLRYCSNYITWKTENGLVGGNCLGVIRGKYKMRKRGKHLGKKSVELPDGRVANIELFDPEPEVKYREFDSIGVQPKLPLIRPVRPITQHVNYTAMPIGELELRISNGDPMAENEYRRRARMW